MQRMEPLLWVANADEWMQALVRLTRAQKQQCLFLVVDLCHFDEPLLATIAGWKPALDYWLLFEHTPEAVIGEQGPLLLALDVYNPNQVALLGKICQCCYDDNRLLALLSREVPPLLAKHLRAAMQLRWTDEAGSNKEGLLRYYTPDLFEAITAVMTPEQLVWFNRYVSQWLVRPDDEPLQVLAVPPPPASLSIEALVFTPAQYNSVLLWGNVFEFYRKYGADLRLSLSITKHQLLARLYEVVVLADARQVYDQQRLEMYCFEQLMQVAD